MPKREAGGGGGGGARCRASLGVAALSLLAIAAAGLCGVALLSSSQDGARGERGRFELVGVPGPLGIKGGGQPWVLGGGDGAALGELVYQRELRLKSQKLAALMGRKQSLVEVDQADMNPDDPKASSRKWKPFVSDKGPYDNMEVEKYNWKGQPKLEENVFENLGAKEKEQLDKEMNPDDPKASSRKWKPFVSDDGPYDKMDVEKYNWKGYKGEGESPFHDLEVEKYQWKGYKGEGESPFHDLEVRPDRCPARLFSVRGWCSRCSFETPDVHTIVREEEGGNTAGGR